MALLRATGVGMGRSVRLLLRTERRWQDRLNHQPAGIKRRFFSFYYSSRVVSFFSLFLSSSFLYCPDCNTNFVEKRVSLYGLTRGPLFLNRVKDLTDRWSSSVSRNQFLNERRKLLVLPSPFHQQGSSINHLVVSTTPKTLRRLRESDGINHCDQSPSA